MELFGVDGINFGEFLVIFVFAALILGPQRLSRCLMEVKKAIRRVRDLATGATTQLKEQLGPEFESVDWAAYDPRQYDPRRIVREALADTAGPEDVRSASPTPPTAKAFDPDRNTPFDLDAT